MMTLSITWNKQPQPIWQYVKKYLNEIDATKKRIKQLKLILAAQRQASGLNQCGFQVLTWILFLTIIIGQLWQLAYFN